MCGIRFHIAYKKDDSVCHKVSHGIQDGMILCAIQFHIVIKIV